MSKPVTTSLYDVLGIARDADLAAIKAAYRKLAQAHHPDKGGDLAQFQAIQLAYDVLSNPERRRRYDENGQTDNGPSLRDEAVSRIATMLATLMEQADVERTDLIEKMREAIIDRQGKDQAMVEKLRESIDRRERALKRFRFKGNGSNLMEQIVRSEIQKRLDQIEAGEREHTLHEEMLAVLAEYSYENDRMVPAPERWPRFTTLNVG